jgi:hypothetical protein
MAMPCWTIGTGCKMVKNHNKSKAETKETFEMHTISQIVPLAGFVLAIQFGDGTTGTIDFNPTIKKKGVFKKLGHEAFFRQAKIGKTRRTVVWPNEIDFDADSLYLKATGRSRAKTRKSA